MIATPLSPVSLAEYASRAFDFPRVQLTVMMLLARWPLGHFFHSDHFTLVALERQPNIGSDHFPVLLTLAYEPRKAEEQQEPDATEQEEEAATEMVQSAIFNRPDTVRDKLDL